MAMTEEHKKAISEAMKRKHALHKLGDAVIAPPGSDNVGVPYPTPDKTPPAEYVSPGLDITIQMIRSEPKSDPFAVWLKTPEGWACSDPRVPQDRVRFATYLEDVLRKAFNAGYREGSV